MTLMRPGLGPKAYEIAARLSPGLASPCLPARPGRRPSARGDPGDAALATRKGNG